MRGGTENLFKGRLFLGLLSCTISFGHLLLLLLLLLLLGKQMHTHLNTISVAMFAPNAQTDLGRLNSLLEYSHDCQRLITTKLLKQTIETIVKRTRSPNRIFRGRSRPWQEDEPKHESRWGIVRSLSTLDKLRKTTWSHKTLCVGSRAPESQD